LTTLPRLGARIKSESKAVKEWILCQEKKDGHYFERNRDSGERLISDKRAKKDAYNRERGVVRLRSTATAN